MSTGKCIEFELAERLQRIFWPAFPEILVCKRILLCWADCRDYGDSKAKSVARQQLPIQTAIGHYYTKMEAGGVAVYRNLR